jgi:hypothetical protein
MSLLNIARFVRPSLNLIYPMTVGMPITVPEDFNYNTMNSRGDYNYCHRFFVTIWKSTTTTKRVTLKRNCGMGLPFTPKPDHRRWDQLRLRIINWPVLESFHGRYSSDTLGLMVNKSRDKVKQIYKIQTSSMTSNRNEKTGKVSFKI